MHARYTVQITPQPDGYPGFLVTSADFSPLTSDGDTREDAVANARGALLATIETLIEIDQPVPPPGSAPGVEIDLGTLVAAKIILNNLRLQAGLNRAQLAQRLGTNPAAGYRILSVLHASRMDQIDRALAALGYRAEFAAAAAE